MNSRHVGPVAKLMLLTATLTFSTAPLFAKSKPVPPPTTWWPDPSAGLMWAGNVSGSYLNWANANTFCSNLQIDAYTGWRLPEMSEVLTILTPYTDTFNLPNFNPHRTPNTYNAPTYEVRFNRRIGFFIWTSTPYGDKYWAAHPATRTAISTPSLSPAWTRSQVG